MSNCSVKAIGPYRGYVGSCKYSEDDDIYWGELINSDDFILYEGDNTAELYQSFKDSVDDYIEMLNWLGRSNWYGNHCLSNIFCVAI